MGNKWCLLRHKCIKYRTEQENKQGVNEKFKTSAHKYVNRTGVKQEKIKHPNRSKKTNKKSNNTTKQIVSTKLINDTSPERKKKRIATTNSHFKRTHIKDKVLQKQNTVN